MSFFGSLALVGIASGGGLACALCAIALCALSVALEALEVDNPAAPWVVAVIAWVGPALPSTGRAYSVTAGTVDDWLPVFVLTAILAPLAAWLLWRDCRP